MIKKWIFLAGSDSNPSNDPVAPLGTPDAGEHTQEVQAVTTVDGEYICKRSIVERSTEIMPKYRENFTEEKKLKKLLMVMASKKLQCGH